jgi:hypothetical protein
VHIVVRQPSNLLALLAASVFPLQMPICVCAVESHAHVEAGQSAQDDHHSAADEHDHVIAMHHSHGDPHSSGVAHSHHPGPCHEAGHTNSVPPSGDDDHGPCQCSAQDTLAATLPHFEKIESAERSLQHWMNASASIADAMGHGPAFSMTHGPPSWAGQNLLASFQGNPCALLCRWLI